MKAFAIVGQLFVKFLLSVESHGVNQVSPLHLTTTITSHSLQKTISCEVWNRTYDSGNYPGKPSAKITSGLEKALKSSLILSTTVLF